MNDFVFVDTSFDKNKTKEYVLSIQVSLDGFSFTVLNGNKKCIVLNRFSPFLKNGDKNPIASFVELVRNHELLNLDFKQITVLWVSNKILILPEEFFSEEFAFESFQLSHDLKTEDSLLWNKIPELNAWGVFSIPTCITDFIHSHFANVKLYHHSLPFFSLSLKEKLPDGHPQVFLNVQNDFFHVIIPDRKGKHFINTFTYNTDSDLAYYILNIFKQQNLNNERSKLIIDGAVQEESKVVQLLKKYLGQVEVKLLPLEFRINGSIPHKEYNQFINLLNLSKCE
ncbi:MAG: DUF3822 family protein [Labilibaculum sp.]|nr:DUF3822 family protein [Labilibaculum sp.]MBI9059272.1 DUF3822 family protein [Labilibaculum sp.]